MQTEQASSRSTVLVRPLREEDLASADHVMRLAFGTFLGLPEPTSFLGDANYVHSRWRADPEAAFAAEVGGELAGSNFASRWGSVGFFGPLTIRPDLWELGIGKRLMEPIMECFARWGTAHAGLFTFAQSPKHVGLYKSFGFWPRFLTTVLSKAVSSSVQASGWTRFSETAPDERDAVLSACRALTDEIFEGLDVRREIESVEAQGLGDTILLWGDRGLDGLAVCHSGPGSEAGSGTSYLKFGASRADPAGSQRFGRLLDACEEAAAKDGSSRLVAGVSTARQEACRVLAEHGFRTDMQGVAMHRPNEEGYSRPGVYVLDDWR